MVNKTDVDLFRKISWGQLPSVCIPTVQFKSVTKQESAMEAPPETSSALLHLHEWGGVTRTRRGTSSQPCLSQSFEVKSENSDQWRAAQLTMLAPYCGVPFILSPNIMCLPTGLVSAKYHMNWLQKNTTSMYITWYIQNLSLQV